MKLAVLTLLISANVAAAFPVTVKSCDREVTFDAAPERAISNDVNLTEMMLVLGLRDRMVGYTGISGWKTLDPEAREGVAELPELSAQYPSKEVLVGAEADFFFAGWNYGMKVGGEVTPETLEPFGIKTYELTESCIFVGPKARSTMDDMYADLLNLGTIFGVSETAEALVAGYKARLEKVTAGVDRSAPLRVFVYDSGEESPFTAGKYAIPTALIEAAGGVNIMDDLEKSWAAVAWEPVVERNPQVIVIVNYGDVTAEQKIAFLEENPAFAGMDAVKNDRYVVLEYVEATPGPRNIRAVEKLVAGFWAK
ncbi:MAG: ABC transporter substrate-binding protein [Tabrizicola sp.]|uniref:ABC transporter substrate-binding protein n=1 Tax=Tabrizicola sp. TaxID=2005166 RepID=UPI0027352E33|nr:ABC transporter substrate-binding protein [Tabrizicola sp.]MDP3262650.1 ABC transporter substrate-binding protein [Tabrizicola sp.]MDP3647810.1 ABC transporter substrate-binding protein [Paracoccaceae bacterium]MDZ4069266.1 ABC transporter substrate-binding protein [Tabrizicola sp.]